MVFSVLGMVIQPLDRGENAQYYTNSRMSVSSRVILERIPSHLVAANFLFTFIQDSMAKKLNLGCPPLMCVKPLTGVWMEDD